MDSKPRTRFITHREASILFLDYSNVTDTETALKLIGRSRRIIAHQPEGSLLTLTYVEGSTYDTRVVQALKELTAHNKPYVRAAAVVGLNGLRRIVYRTVIAFSRRDIRVFTDLETAKNWLAGHA